MNIRMARLTITLLALISIAFGCTRQQDAPDLKQTKVLQTPAAQGSMASNLAAGPDGSIVLSWIEPEGDGDALRFSVFEDGNWATTRTVASGEDWFVNWADFPSVVPVSESRWAAHWLQRREAGGYAYDIRAVLSDGLNDRTVHRTTGNFPIVVADRTAVRWSMTTTRMTSAAAV